VGAAIHGQGEQSANLFDEVVFTPFFKSLQLFFLFFIFSSRVVTGAPCKGAAALPSMVASRRTFCIVFAMFASNDNELFSKVTNTGRGIAQNLRWKKIDQLGLLNGVEQVDLSIFPFDDF